MSNITLGIIGGGQLGSMLAIAAKKLNISTVIFCDDKDAPAQNFCNKFIAGDYNNKEKIIEFVNHVDIVTFEFENIPFETLNEINKLKPVIPKPSVNRLIQHRLAEKDFINKFKDNKPNLRRPFKSHLRNAQYEDFTHVKLPRSLRYTDRNSMRNSVEARLPLLDHEVVEWCYQIPSRFKFLYSQDRIILKEPFKNNINKKVLFKNKRTIADPQTYWLKKTLRPLIEDTINSSSFLSNDLFNQKKLINYYNNFKNEKAHINSSFFIKILLTEWWRNKVLLNS